jgi:hypothetical protein
MKMEVFNECLVGNWIASNSITNFLSVIGHKVRIHRMSTNKESESNNLSSSKATPKKPTHKGIHIHKPTIVACLESHIM